MNHSMFTGQDNLPWSSGSNLHSLLLCYELRFHKPKVSLSPHCFSSSSYSSSSQRVLCNPCRFVFVSESESRVKRIHVECVRN